jgi:hypothetical protein
MHDQLVPCDYELTFRSPAALQAFFRREFPGEPDPNLIQ